MNRRASLFFFLASLSLTAGASAPEILVTQVLARLKALGAVSVQRMPGDPESVKFPLPKGLRPDQNEEI